MGVNSHISIRNFIYYWLPPLAWMGAIFFMSSRVRFDITSDFLLDFAAFKMLHMIEFAFLYYLLFRALNRTTNLPRSTQLAYAAAIAIVYAISDEVHQQLVPTREGKLRDILIDTAGILFAYWWIRRNVEYVVKKLL